MWTRRRVMIAAPLLYGIACAVPAAYFTPDVGGHNLVRFEATSERP